MGVGSLVHKGKGVVVTLTTHQGKFCLYNRRGLYWENFTVKRVEISFSFPVRFQVKVNY